MENKINNIYVIGDLHNDAFRIDGVTERNLTEQHGGFVFVREVLKRKPELNSIADIENSDVVSASDSKFNDKKRYVDLGSLVDYIWPIFKTSKKNGFFRCRDRLGVEVYKSRQNKNVYFDTTKFKEIFSKNLSSISDNRYNSDELDQNKKNNVFLFEYCGSQNLGEYYYNSVFNTSELNELILENLALKNICRPDIPNLFWILHKDIPKILNEKNLNSSADKAIQRSSVIFLNANAIRKQSVYIRKHVTWESTAQDYICALYTNPFFDKIKDFNHIITRFGVTGAIYSYRLGSSRWLHRLMFSPNANKTGFYRDVATEGEVIGYQTIFSTCVLNEIIHLAHENKAKIIDSVSVTEKICEGVKKAITCCQEIFDKGLGKSTSKCQDYFLNSCQEYFTKAHNSTEYLKVADLRIPVANPAWSILVQSAEYKLTIAAEQLVLNGVSKALNNCGASPETQRVIWAPIIKFDKLVVIDKREIESYLVIHGLISKAINTGLPKILSLAVFGPPGSGKSFTVKSLTNSAHAEFEDQVEFKTINLTKVKDPGSLENLILDYCWSSYKSGKVPVIFFDEFDCNYENVELGWLKYFLSPMEDFSTKDFLLQVSHRLKQLQKTDESNTLTHPADMSSDISLCEKSIKHFCKGDARDFDATSSAEISQKDQATINVLAKKPIFVFAGGTKHKYLDFCREDNSWTEEQKAYFASIKGPDFVSRLSGHIDILGPNRVDDYDDSYVIRRALLLRSFLLEKFELNEEDNGQEVSLDNHVDPAIVRALLKVSSFKHGARSMRAIVNMSNTIGGAHGKVVSSTLPTLPQINMHVNGKEFLDMVTDEEKS